MNMQESKKLIAEFMEIELFGEDQDFTEALLICGALDFTVNPCTHFNNVLETIYLSDMKFNTSWDWLMPVVEKIENTGFVSHIGWTIDLGFFVIEVETDGESRTLESHRNYGTNIELVYKAVVNFIQWYNQNKND